MCKNICATSSRPTYSYFLSFPHSLSTTLSPSYGLSLAMFILLLSFCISTNASMRLFSVHLTILTSCLCYMISFYIFHRYHAFVLLIILYVYIYIYMHIYTSYILNTSYYIVQIRRGNLLLYARGPSISLLIELIDEKDQG